MDQAFLSRLERGDETVRIETCIKLAEAIGCVYQGVLYRGDRRVTGRLAEFDISGLGDVTLDHAGKFAAAFGCIYVSELHPIEE